MKKCIDALFAGVLAYCVIGFITGIINMISFFQIIGFKFSLPPFYSFINENDQEFFLVRSIILSVVAFVCACAVAFACVFFILKKCKASQITAIVISSLSIIGSFIALFAVNNISGLPTNDPSSDIRGYYDLTVQQMLADAARPLFISIIVTSVMLIIYAIIKNADNTADASESF
ncbi:MAG: hypothetical protein IJX02_04645 [Clostridia bacterium]|nr:hypothetical protein [Clostridia bacterium]